MDESGSEFAFVKLVQDYAKWTKNDVVIKFLDVEKFFDTMNFKLALIQAYLYGVVDTGNAIKR